MKVAVIGTGYVGLVVGAGLSDFGHNVVCVDRDTARIETLEGGKIPFFEPGLEELVRRNAERGRLSFTCVTAAAVADAEIVFLAVGTPQGTDGAADISAVLEVAEEVGRALTDWSVIVTKSTVPVGTSEKVKQIVAAVCKHEFAVASNPEFLKQGDALADFVRPARIVVGTDDPRAEETMRKLYRPFCRTGDKVQVMDLRSAELAKYGANALLATRITFMNELALLAERIGANIDHVRRVIGTDPRIGNRYLFPGAGYGGSCFPKDVRALRHMGEQCDLPLELAEATDRANERQKRVLAGHVIARFGGDLSGKTMAVWGAAFKPNTDDVREAPSITLIEQLLAAGAAVRVSDPSALANLEIVLGDRVEYVLDKYEAATDVDALILVTEWHNFRTPDFERLAQVMKGKSLFDGRGVWDQAELGRAGFTCKAIGRP